jgi:hypothetical protein
MCTSEFHFEEEWRLYYLKFVVLMALLVKGTIFWGVSQRIWYNA